MSLSHMFLTEGMFSVDYIHKYRWEVGGATIIPAAKEWIRGRRRLGTRLHITIF